MRMRKKVMRTYMYEFSDGVFFTHFKRDDLPVKPRKGKSIILPGCSSKIASKLVGRLRKGYVVRHDELMSCGGGKSGNKVV